MMGDLFGRVAWLQMGTIEVHNLRVSFIIDKSDEPEPNTAEIAVWNLARNTKALLKTQIPLYVKLVAGYDGNESQLFEGDINPDGISSVKDNVDWVTTFRAGDGLEAYRSARIQESFKKGTNIITIIKKLANSMGVGLGNAIEKISQGDVSGALTEMVEGATISGPVPREFDRLLASIGYTYSIQDGQLQIIEKGGQILRQVAHLTPDTGLIGSPEPGADGFTKFRSLLQPKLVPSHQVKLETSSYNGLYVLRKIRHNGDTHGANWFSDCEAKAA
jgi:hypothetical protein